MGRDLEVEGLVEPRPPSATSPPRKCGGGPTSVINCRLIRIRRLPAEREIPRPM